jgi:hypothetical protein
MSIKQEQSLIDRPSLEALSNDLSRAFLLRRTHKAGREIYIFRGQECPALLTEVGRLREWSFREAGGGTGKELDLDAYDQGPQAYEQLIVWDPVEAEIVAGYRMRMGAEALESAAGSQSLSTSSLFVFSEEFLRDFLPHTLELGRSFVQPSYQPGTGGKASIFSLDNLWDGLGALFVTRPQLRYLFGKVTMFTHYNSQAKDILMSFLKHFFPDRDKLVWPKDEVLQQFSGPADESTLWGTDYKEAYQLLNRRLRSLGENIPPLINSYMNLSLSMRTFGTAINDAFGFVEETGIMVTIADIYPEKKQRHMDTYVAP